MNKSEIQARIEKVESELAKLKADLAKCDCADGIEQEKCWCCLNNNGWVISAAIRNRNEAASVMPSMRPAYMPECRQVTVEDAKLAHDAWGRTWPHFDNFEQFMHELHKLGFRMKVQP